MRRWSVGQLARASGVTVRALHYYDEIGLVSASERTSAGHRRYTEPDVRRLYRLRALHQLGLSLDEIGGLLDAGAQDPAALRDLLAAQLADVDATAERLAQRRARITELLDRLDAGAPEPGQLLATLDRTTPLVDATTYLSPDQWTALQRRGAQLGPAAVDALRSEWLGLLRRLVELVRQGVPRTDPQARSLAGRWREIGTALRGGTATDTGLNSALGTLWREQGAAIDQGLAQRLDWLEPGELAAVMSYVEDPDDERR